MFTVSYDALRPRYCRRERYQYIDDARRQELDVPKYNLILELVGGEMTMYRRPVCWSRND